MLDPPFSKDGKSPAGYFIKEKVLVLRRGLLSINVKIEEH